VALRSIVWMAVLAASGLWSLRLPAEELQDGLVPPPGAMPEPAGRPIGYHQRHYGGIGQGTLPAIWRDLDDVYQRDMYDVFTYRPRLWRYGYPVGYGIDAPCLSGGPFGVTQRCGLTPLHYNAEASLVFAGPRPPLTGASWYSLQPAGAVFPGSEVSPDMQAPSPTEVLPNPKVQQMR